LCRDKELIWKANSVDQFNERGFDTVISPDTDHLLMEYILHEASESKRGKRRIVTWFCGKLASWNGEITKAGFQGRVMVLPILPAWVCGCSPREIKKEERTLSQEKEPQCLTIHEFVRLDTVLPHIAPCIFDKFTSNPPLTQEAHALWVLYIPQRVQYLSDEARLLCCNLNTFSVDTFILQIPSRNRLSLTGDITASDVLISVKDSVFVIAASNHLFQFRIHKHVVSFIQCMDLSFEPSEIRLLSSDRLYAFSYLSADSTKLEAGTPQIHTVDLKTRHTQSTTVPFLVPEVLQINPNHYVSISNHRIFVADAFNYRIRIYNENLLETDSLGRFMNWNTIPEETLSDYKQERDSLTKRGRNTLSCSTVDFSLAPGCFNHWDKICGIYALNDSNLLVVYQKRSACYSNIIKQYYPSSKEYIPFFYDFWQWNGQRNAFALLHQDIEEYFPPIESISSKSNYPLNVLSSLPVMNISDSTIAVWYTNPSPLGISFAHLKNKFISTIIHLSKEQSPAYSPSLYIYRMH
jgi:hypothetical protein